MEMFCPKCQGKLSAYVDVMECQRCKCRWQINLTFDSGQNIEPVENGLKFEANRWRSTSEVLMEIDYGY